MVTIARVVEKIIKENPSLEIALAKDLLSYSKLARYLHEEVEKETGRKVKDPAIIVALKRMREKAEKMYEPKKSFSADEITTVTSQNIPEIIQKLYEIDEVKKGSVLNITQGNKQTTFIFSEKIEKEVRKIIQTERIISEIKDLSQISISFNKQTFETPGFLVYVLKEISWNNINIIEIISTYTEFAIIVESEDLMKAYGILKKVLF